MVTKITNRSVLTFLGLGLLSFFFSAPVFSAPKTLAVSIALPTQSLDFSDMDVRDKFNRPAKDTLIARAFATTVQSLLLKSLVENLTPNNRFIQNILSLKHDVVCGWIKRGVQKTVETVQAIINSGKKWMLFVLTARVTAAASVPALKINFSHNSFYFLISSLLSSTQILR